MVHLRWPSKRMEITDWIVLARGSGIKTELLKNPVKDSRSGWRCKYQFGRQNDSQVGVLHKALGGHCWGKVSFLFKEFHWLVLLSVDIFLITAVSTAPIPGKVWANTILTLGSPECLTVRLTVRSQWAHCYHCMVSSSVDLTNRSQQAHGVRCKLAGSSQQGHIVRSSRELAV